MISDTKGSKPAFFIQSNYIKKFFNKYKLHYFFGLIALLAVDYVQTLVPLIVGNVIDQIELNNFDADFVANAVFNATGKRYQSLPITIEKE